MNLFQIIVYIKGKYMPAAHRNSHKFVKNKFGGYINESNNCSIGYPITVYSCYISFDRKVFFAW